MHNLKKICFIPVLIFLVLSAGFSEEDKVPEPYKDEEFPQWTKDLRRAEIVFFGSLPFSFLIAFESVEVCRYFSHDMDSLYRPWPFRDASAPAYTQEEQLWIIGTALIVSGIIALTDFIIGKITHRDEMP